MRKQKTTVVSGRIPPELKTKMKQQGLTVKNAIELAIHIKLNPKTEYEAELRNLLSENERLSNKIIQNNRRIEELKELVGYNENIDQLKEKIFKNDNEKAIQRTLNRYISWKGKSNAKIQNFIESKTGKAYIERQLNECNLTEDEFKLELLNRYNDSKQTILNQ